MIRNCLYLFSRKSWNRMNLNLRPIRSSRTLNSYLMPAFWKKYQLQWRVSSNNKDCINYWIKYIEHISQGSKWAVWFFPAGIGLDWPLFVIPRYLINCKRNLNMTLCWIFVDDTLSLSLSPSLPSTSSSLLLFSHSDSCNLNLGLFWLLPCQYIKLRWDIVIDYHFGILLFFHSFYGLKCFEFQLTLLS